MASKVVANVDSLMSELTRARSRVENQRKLLRDAEESQRYALASGLAHTEIAMRARVKRLRETLVDSEKVVSELEAATGSLPLK